MRIYGKSELKDYITLFFSHHYIFKAKQHLMTRMIFVVMVLMNFALKFSNSYKNVQSDRLNEYIFYLITDTLMFFFYLLIGLSILKFIYAIFVYSHYKNLYKDSDYTEINEDKIIVNSALSFSVNMQDLVAVVQLKDGYLLEFKNLAVLFIPFRFFENKETAINLFESIRNKYLSDTLEQEEINAQVN